MTTSVILNYFLTENKSHVVSDNNSRLHAHVSVGILSNQQKERHRKLVQNISTFSLQILKIRFHAHVTYLILNLTR